MSLQIETISSLLLTSGTIFLAEMGDKSQLVCMTLAAKHKAKPVLLGAVLAFSLLNLIAVSLGASLSHFIPQDWLTLGAAGLFGIFGVKALISSDEDEESVEAAPSNRSIFLTTFVMIFLAELGDKTQLATVSLSTTYSPSAIWLAATTALIATSVIGVYAGRKLVSKINTERLHKLSGILFLVLAALLISSLM